MCIIPCLTFIPNLRGTRLQLCCSAILVSGNTFFEQAAFDQMDLTNYRPALKIIQRTVWLKTRVSQVTQGFCITLFFNLLLHGFSRSH